MFEELLKAYMKLGGSPREINEDILQLIPDRCTAQDLRNFLSNSGDEQDHVALLSAAHTVTLKISNDVKEQEPTDESNSDEALCDIADRTSSLILPLCSGDSLDEDETNYTILQHKGELGLLILTTLTKLSPKASPLHLPPSTLLRITAFTNPTDLWTTAESSALSQSLLSSQLEHLNASQVQSLIVQDILTSFLRPLFSKSRPATITASGRKAEFIEPSRYDGAARESPETKPWKYAHRYAVTVFEWAVEHADSTLLQSHWPLFTPVLLTLIDEPGPTALKIRSLGILRAFWARCPAGLMQNTGLAEVIEQAVFPAVLYLPSLTPEDESLEILGAAYPALTEMAGLTVDRPLVVTEVITTEKQTLIQKPTHGITEGQRKLLDKIIREGIMVGYHHSKEHDFIPMLSEIMTDPFGAKHPPTLASGIKLLQTILRNCWPRIPHYCNEVIKILMLCWLVIEDEETFSHDSPIANDLKSGLTQAAGMLSAIMKAAQIDFRKRVDPLIEKGPFLDKLFGEITS
ncbi:hypothetical protein F5Y11DRAFT_350755 [Daldinia sp. FL1419]|nr:hypothetical protein F5Y11DRAFT_350755 [Daldinia sp. FL1419]